MRSERRNGNAAHFHSRSKAPDPLPASTLSASFSGQLITTDHIGQLAGTQRGEVGWGLGFAIRRRVRDGDIGSTGTFGWAGGTGAQWWVDPIENIVAVLVTPCAPPVHQEVFQQFERLTCAALVESRADPQR